MADARQCEHTKPDGQRCRGSARPGSALCPFHDPETRRRANEGRRKGGRSSHKARAVLSEDTPDFPLGTAGDVRAMLAATVNMVLKGRLDVKIANCAAYTAGLLLRSIEGDDFERRLAEIEDRLKATRP